MSNLSQFFGSRCPTGAFNLTIATNTINFQGIVSDLGSWSSGGHIMCKSGGTAWIVAPRCAEVSRSWYCRDDAVLVANACTVPYNTGWFVPTCAQLVNPGYNCKQYWDIYTIPCGYWTSTDDGSSNACSVLLCWEPTVLVSSTCKGTNLCVRAFRCVTY